MAVPWYAQPTPVRPASAQFSGWQERDKAMREYVAALQNPATRVPTTPTPTRRPAPAPPPPPPSPRRPSGPSQSQIAAQQARAAQAAAAKAQAEAARKEKERASKAAKKYSGAAERLMQQARALKTALGSSGYKKRLTQQLANSDVVFEEADSLVLEQYARGRKELERKLDTTEGERERGTVDALTNSARERSEAVQQVVLQGAGGTDMLKAMTSALRNWQANQTEVQANYADALDALNSSESEMVNMVRSQRTNAWQQREEQRATLHHSYYDQMSQTWTDYGNKMGEAANMWAEAIEEEKTSARTKKEKETASASKKAFGNAAKFTGKAYKTRGVSSAIQNWEGQGEFEKDPYAARRFARPQLEFQEAEGATLRRWEQ